LAAVPPAAIPQSSPYFKRASSAIALTDDGSRLLVANPDSNTVTLLDPLIGEKLAELAVGVDPRTVALGPNGRGYVANRGSGTVSVLDLTGPAVIATVPVGRQPYGVVASADGAFVFVANTGDDTVSVIDAASLQVIAAIPVHDRPAGLAATATRLYVTHLLTGLVSVLDISGLPDTVPYCGSMDFDADGDVDLADVAYATDHWSAACRDSGYIPAADLDSDCRIGIAEVMAVAQRVGPATCTVISTGSTSNLAQSIVIDPWESFAYLPHVKSNAANPAPLSIPASSRSSR
jgi:YVTN family beta-propeller protein